MESLNLNIKDVATELGVSQSYIARIAKRAKEDGSIWPEKKGRDWIAPVQEWKQLLSVYGSKRIAKEASERFNNSEMQEKYISSHYEEYSATRAAKTIGGISPRWLIELANRCNRLGLEWPKRHHSRGWIAPLQVWRSIIANKNKIRSWMWSRKKE